MSAKAAPCTVCSTRSAYSSGRPTASTPKEFSNSYKVYIERPQDPGSRPKPPSAPWRPAVQKDIVPGASLNKNLAFIDPDDRGRQFTEVAARDRPIKEYWESIGYAGPDSYLYAQPEVPISQRQPVQPAYGAPTPAEIQEQRDINRFRAQKTNFLLGYEEAGPLGAPSQIRR